MSEESTESEKQIVGIMAKYPTRIDEIGIDLLVENPWNPNKQSEKVTASIKASIERFGLIQFPLVRDYVGQYQIIDGEYRWKICRGLGHRKIKVFIMGDKEHPVSDEDAMTLTQLLNTRGFNDPILYGKFIKEIEALNPAQFDLFAESPQEIENFKQLIDFDFSIFEKEEVVDSKRKREMTFLLSIAERGTVRRALSLTKKPPSEGLMFIINEYLAGK